MIGDDARGTFRSASLCDVVSLGDSPAQVVVSRASGDSFPAWCLSSYRVRAVGDKVLVVQLDGASSFLVVGKVGPDANAPAAVSYGIGAPAGGGWRSFTTGYIRDRIDGTLEVYCDTAGSTPMPSVVSATGAAGFLANTTIGIDFPRAGAESITSGDWTGVWFYSGGIAAACVGKTVAKMTVRIARGTGGRNAPVLIHLGLHNSTGLQTSLTNVWDPGVSLSRGGAAQIDIPALQRGLLANGSLQGIGVLGTGPEEYADFTPSADVTITFA